MVARRFWRWPAIVFVVIIVLIALVVMFIYSGIYNVAATYPDSRPVALLLSATMSHSVKRHAKGIKVPQLDDPKMIKAGLEHYKDDCVVCHGAPGTKVGEIGRGLTPPPPELTEAAKDWKTNELFWITKHGVRMTGMPAWGKIDEDEELWQTVAFVRKLPSMTSAQYRQMSRQASED